MTSLLQPGDPQPALVLNLEGASPILLVCEHAGQGVPMALGNLGIGREDLDKHIGWDIGAAALTRQLSELLDATAVYQYYSRLVVDCNRPPEAFDSIPEVSDGVPIPGNRNLNDREARISEIFRPFQSEVTRLLDSGRYKIALSIHSFTPEMGGAARPWDVGFLYRKDQVTSRRLSNFLEITYPAMCIGHNEPYAIDDLSDWFVPHHGEARGLPHSLIEVRNDHIDGEQGQRKWAEVLAAACRHLLNEAF